ncbi:MAG: division/cell wall cluster transcriptional repressor MraZ [Planctomycetota bacterium]|jgi:MraZ protein
MFIGHFEHRLDAKNRLSIPRQFRDAVKTDEEKNGFFVTPGLDICLFLFTSSQWDSITQALKGKPLTDSAVRRFQRLFFSNAAYCELDNQGRILIPAHLKQTAQLNKKATIVGVHSRIEVWSSSRWKAVQEADIGEYEALAERLF